MSNVTIQVFHLSVNYILDYGDSFSPYHNAQKSESNIRMISKFVAVSSYWSYENNELILI